MNPFSLPNSDPELYLVREQQRSVERSITADERGIPVYLRHYKKHNQMLEELRRIPTKIEASLNKSRRSHSFNRENIQDLILRKREILLTKKKIEHKKNNISLLDTITHTREEEHKKAAKALEDNLLRVEKYEECLKAEAKKKADMTEKKTQERMEKQLEISSLEQDIASLYVNVERRTEELRQLSVYKDFVLELCSVNDNNNTTTFVTQNIEDMYTPNYLLNSINSLEKNNLFLIQQAQEAEQTLENLKSKGLIEEKQLDHHNNILKFNIKNSEKQKEITTSKHAAILNEKIEKALVSPETMALIHESLVSIFIDIRGDPVNCPSDFEILEDLENSIRAEIEKSNLLGDEILRKREKEIDKVRRKENVEMLKIKEIEKAKEKSDILNRRKQKIIKKTGRKGMERSKIPEKEITKEKIIVPQEILDRREFLEEYIPYP